MLDFINLLVVFLNNEKLMLFKWIGKNNIFNENKYMFFVMI